MAVIDLFLVYSMIKRLATPFSEWRAYNLGIIDERGNLLKKRRDLTTVEEREAYGIFDNMIRKLKRLIEKVPGGKTRLASYAAALYLIKENYEDHEELTEEELYEHLEKYMVPLNESHVNIQFETMMAGGGAIAGLPPDEPVVKKKDQWKIIRRNQIKKMRSKK